MLTRENFSKTFNELYLPGQPGKPLSTPNELSLETPLGPKLAPHFTLGFNSTEGPASAIS
jgi:hypothetical protein